MKMFKHKGMMTHTDIDYLNFQLIHINNAITGRIPVWCLSCF